MHRITLVSTNQEGRVSVEWHLPASKNDPQAVGSCIHTSARAPRQIVLDIDDTFDAVHGHQQLRLFNAHYDEYGFQPIVVFDGDGRLVGAVLRAKKAQAISGD